jgi:mannose-1-phosphate guanylyltransferase
MFEHYLFPLLVEKGEPLYSYPSLAYWIDMGTPEKYLQLHRDLLTSQTATRLSGLESPSHMGNPPTRGRTEFDVGEPLEGPAMMGRNCAIGSQVQLKGPVVLGDECKIGDNTIIEGSVLWQRVRVGQNVTIRNCIMADDCFIGDDCVVVDSVLADNVVVAKGTTLKPGSKIWPGTRIVGS